MSASPRIIDLNDGWNKEIKAKAIDRLEEILNNGLDKKQARMFEPKEYVQTYTTCYNMCTQKSPYNWSEQLYTRHGETISQYLLGTVLPALRDRHGEFLLKELTKRWQNHEIMNKWMQRFFMYLDRYYVKHHSLPSLEKAGKEIFKRLIFNEVKADVAAAMLDIINQERDGAVIDRQLIKQCVALFEAMGMGCLDAYNMDFEEKLLQSTKEYYTRKSSEWIDGDGTPVYMVKAENALAAEKERVGNYLNPGTEGRLLGVVEDEILAKREMVLLEKEGSGLRVLLANDKLEDLSRMYRLFSKSTEWLLPIAQIVKEHITHMGGECVNRRQARVESMEKEKNEDADFIKEVLDLHDKYTALVEAQFDSNSLFQKALKDAFVEFVNRDVGKFPNSELMGSYCDKVLRTGGEKLSDQEVEATLEKTVQLFSYLVDKDLFAEIYRNQLAKRLLNKRSASDEHEKLMITKLKQRCGSQFTSKLEGMLNDLNIGKDHEEEFKEFYAANQAAGGGGGGGGSSSSSKPIDFGVQVLTTGYWPQYPTYDLHLPPEMTRDKSCFASYYEEKNNKRRLQWQWGLGDAEVRGSWGKKNYDLQVTTLQAVVLLDFNRVSEGAASEWEGFEAIRERLNLPEEALKRVMHSLSCGKHKVLVKQPASSSVKPTDTFKPAPKFVCKMLKVRIPMASLDDSGSQNKRVAEDRTVAIEAAIVRIMKARKTLLHQQLVAEVLSQLAFFKPEPKVVKRRIEALIDREYLERDADTPNTYKYLA